ncbi:MAG: 50S ribosomal protein L4 [Armatimonadota bacterium]|nr:50S ribosomal protein L4 [Armatimonadota bacterium]MDR7518812.1 50S ribosomal protein L4 [Armatimonadota bacterium]MDR7549657.1 50S ribosomal protein L4 [Armatimonadota bacterium]
MPKVAQFDATGAPQGEVELPDAVFGLRPHRPAMHQALVAEMANRRAGTHATRTRGAVRGGGRKPWRQKGTGRARHGSRRSPLWVGGGIVFGPTPRDHSQRLPRRQRVLALRSALSAHAREGRMVVIDPPADGALKTKTVAALLAKVGASERAILVTAESERALRRAAANLPGTRVLSARRLVLRHLLVPGVLVITRSGLADLQEALGA